MTKTNILTTILSFLTIERFELGTSVNLLFFLFQIFILGGIGIISINARLIYIYYMIIMLFVWVAYKNCDRLSDNDEVDNQGMNLWLSIIKIRFFRMNFISFALTLGAASYIDKILFQTLSELTFAIFVLIFFLLYSTYPICSYLVYKFQIPIRYKALSVFGLISQSMAMMSFVIIKDGGNYTKFSAPVSLFLSQIGLAFITISSFPDMLESTKNGLPHIPFSIVSGRVCSILFAAYYIGKLYIEASVFILRLLMPFSYAMIISSLCILVYAGVYEYYAKGVRNYNKGKVRNENLLLGRELEEPEDLSNWLNS